jgi:hypothetical protein
MDGRRKGVSPRRPWAPNPRRHRLLVREQRLTPQLSTANSIAKSLTSKEQRRNNDQKEEQLLLHHFCRNQARGGTEAAGSTATATNGLAVFHPKSWRLATANQKTTKTVAYIDFIDAKIQAAGTGRQPRHAHAAGQETLRTWPNGIVCYLGVTNTVNCLTRSRSV